MTPFRRLWDVLRQEPEPRALWRWYRFSRHLRRRARAEAREEYSRVQRGDMLPAKPGGYYQDWLAEQTRVKEAELVKARAAADQAYEVGRLKRWQPPNDFGASEEHIASCQCERCALNRATIRSAREAFAQHRASRGDNLPNGQSAETFDLEPGWGARLDAKLYGQPHLTLPDGAELDLSKLKQDGGAFFTVPVNHKPPCTRCAFDAMGTPMTNIDHSAGCPLLDRNHSEG